MGVSIGQAIDYLCTGSSTAGSTLLAALTAVDSTVVLADNEPMAASQSMVFIGRADPGNAEAATGTRQYMVLGAGRSEESYIIPCFISVSRPGPAQKPARDAAIALFDAVAHFVQADLTLGGVLLQGRYAQISQVTLTQTLDENDTGGGAYRAAWVSFDIHCTNHYIP
jgi:hypothetical protein